MEDGELEYEDVMELCNDNLGTIIRIADWNEERVRFSPHDSPQTHSTLVEAGVWRTERFSEPRWSFFVSRGLKNGRGGRSIVNDGNKHFDSYEQAVARVEELASEFDGEEFCWRDLPKKCFDSEGKELSGIGIL